MLSHKIIDLAGLTRSIAVHRSLVGCWVGWTIAYICDLAYIYDVLSCAELQTLNWWLYMY